MNKTIKYFLKETSDDDKFKKGDPIKYKNLKGTVVDTSHYLLTAEMYEMNWKDKLKNWWSK
jgi:hypothetical protein